MRLHDGLHVASFPDGKTEICAGMDTLFSFPALPDKQVRLLKSLVSGISRSDFFCRAKDMGVTRSQGEQLLGQLQGAELISLRASRHPHGPDDSAWRRIGGDAMRRNYRHRSRLRVTLNQRNPWSQMLSEQLHAAGIGQVRFTPKLTHSDLAIFLSWGFPNPLDLSAAMHHNQPYLPIVAGNDYVEVGPLVKPGFTPCANCVSNARATLVSQLQERVASLSGVDFPRIETTLAAMGSSVGIATALAFLDRRAIFPGRVTRIDVDGDIEVMTYEAHANCGCTGLPPELEFPPEPSFSRQLGEGSVS
ncbi:hypothetical protein [Mobiluncus mulieris]|uniref:Bacteriocin biosynthesis cyclodehydratase domain n=1 Tax=Mobiluncus mulieris TaxID=2052 RepID=A0A7Y0U5L8_9ACTO|nr:hypothetical protein [Mobiluncus mulieris]EEZ90889.1 hypothetical protein HMPREF0578_1891 [Mobiluncus mulieris 28-1]MBB5845749.1 hypothetical protein [Mobiluncus mulieris]MCU9968968.1 hypothetical protein [Mobiluncus mulieris]MCU9974278.1 hypothetical protein [Mobiluncus mulieris]MCV0009313.1 hypothetical protein [Mobiluncus mulieris]